MFLACRAQIFSARMWTRKQLPFLLFFCSFLVCVGCIGPKEQRLDAMPDAALANANITSFVLGYGHGCCRFVREAAEHGLLCTDPEFVNVLYRESSTNRLNTDVGSWCGYLCYIAFLGTEGEVNRVVAVQMDGFLRVGKGELDQGTIKMTRETGRGQNLLFQKALIELLERDFPSFMDACRRWLATRVERDSQAMKWLYPKEGE